MPSPGYVQLSPDAATRNLTGQISNGGYGEGLGRGWAAYRSGQLVNEGGWQAGDDQWATPDVAAALEGAGSTPSGAPLNDSSITTPSQSSIQPFSPTIPLNSATSYTTPGGIGSGISGATSGLNNAGTSGSSTGSGGDPSGPSDAINGLMSALGEAPVNGFQQSSGSVYRQGIGTRTPPPMQGLRAGLQY